MLKLETSSRTIKQYGLQKSGTNLTKYILEANFNVVVLVDKLGWKHGYFKDNHVLPVVVTIKNPYSWIISNRRLNFKVGKEAFDKDIPNFILRWNKMNNHWMNIPNDKQIVKYEDLLTAPQEVCSRLEKAFCLKKIRNDLFIPSKTMKKSSDGPINHPPLDVSNNGEQYSRRNYYIKKAYMKEIEDENLKIINSCLDLELMKILGYEIEN